MGSGSAPAGSRASTILIVDDRHEPAGALARLLAAEGFDVRHAAAADQVEEHLAKGAPGIVLARAEASGVDGFDLCRRIRAARGPSVYIILQTTKDRLASHGLSVDEGADDFLIEPVTDREVLARVETGRKMKQLQERLEETNRSLARLEATDPLTGLYNRARLLAELEREIERSRRYGHPVSLVLLDIDEFRGLNEKLGRDAGDRVIVEVGRILKLSTRTTDTVARHGGEELAALLPETGGGHAFEAAEKIRKAVGQTAIAAGERTVHVTVSAGVATFENNNYERADDLAAAAAAALARAKAAGRNRTASA